MGLSVLSSSLTEDPIPAMFVQGQYLEKAGILAVAYIMLANKKFNPVNLYIHYTKKWSFPLKISPVNVTKSAGKWFEIWALSTYKIWLQNLTNEMW